MEIVDTKRLETAILYIERMAEGNNPVNNMSAEEDSVINNPNVIKCLSFIKDVLVEIKRNDGYIGRRPRSNRDKSKQDYPLEALKNFQYYEDKTISKLTEQINDLADMTVYKKVTYNLITAWLKQNGYLFDERIEGTGKHRTNVTEEGIKAGIRSEVRTNPGGVKYHYITYGKPAQELIVANMDKILGYDS